MKEQYLAEIRNGYCKEGEWWNAKMMMLTDKDIKDGKGGRYCKAKEEAQQWIDKAVKKGQQIAMNGHHLGTPPFSIYSEPSEKDLVIETRIRVRQVSQWEVIE